MSSIRSLHRRHFFRPGSHSEIECTVTVINRSSAAQHVARTTGHVFGPDGPMITPLHEFRPSPCPVSAHRAQGRSLARHITCPPCSDTSGVGCTAEVADARPKMMLMTQSRR
jgi:hypothetical protein